MKRLIPLLLILLPGLVHAFPPDSVRYTGPDKDFTIVLPWNWKEVSDSSSTAVIYAGPDNIDNNNVSDLSLVVVIRPLDDTATLAGIMALDMAMVKDIPGIEHVRSDVGTTDIQGKTFKRRIILYTRNGRRECLVEWFTLHRGKVYFLVAYMPEYEGTGELMLFYDRLVQSFTLKGK